MIVGEVSGIVLFIVDVTFNQSSNADGPYVITHPSRWYDSTSLLPS
jgi:hypothetical protein